MTRQKPMTELPRREFIKAVSAAAAGMALKDFQAYGEDAKPPKDTSELLARVEADFKAAYPLERYGYLPYYTDPKMPIYADAEGRLRVKAGRTFGGDGGFGGYTDCADRAWLLAIRLMKSYGSMRTT